MIPVVDIKTMRESDSSTIKEVGSLELMYKAGKSIFEAYDYKGKIAIVCGSGNNAGDGYVLASFIEFADIYLFNDKFSDDGKYYFNKLKNKVFYIDSNTSFDNYDIIVDCIFGTGFNKDIEEPYLSVINKINASKAYVISADINSGINGNTGLAKVAVKSNLTVSIGYMKYGHYLNDAKNYINKLINNNIDIKLNGNCAYLLEDNDCKQLFTKRNENANKKTFGYTGIIAGSIEYSGAAKLANLSYSALRSGCGIAKLYVPKSIENIVAPYILESILIPVSDVDGHMILDDKLRDLTSLDSIAIGMGLGESKAYEEILKYILESYNKPIIIDADGINTLAKMDLSLIKENVLLTPHLKEFSRLTGYNIDDIKANLIAYAKEFASSHNNCTILLKGPSTVVTNGIETYIINKGTCGMSTAGSGDVLSGILAGLFAYSKLSIPLTAGIGAYVNGLAGELGVEEENEISHIARDTIINIKKAITKIQNS